VTDPAPTATAPAGAPHRRRRWPWITAGAAVLVIAGAATALVLTLGHRDDHGIGQLGKRDPNGAAACKILVDWINSGKHDQWLGAALAAGAAANNASTASIHAAAGTVALDQSTLDILRTQGGYSGGNLQPANLPALRAACIGEGVRVGTLPVP
jgi:hypothetical protein